MNFNRPLVSISFLAAFLISTQGFAYTFDAMCAPREVHDPIVSAPRVGFMLDESGSMSNDSSTAGLSRWDASVQAITETVVDYTLNGPNNDTAQFGLGVFGNGASWLFPAQEDSHAPGGIPDILAAWSFGGFTNIGNGAEELEQENSLATASTNNYGIIITDGAPTNGCSVGGAEDEMIDAIRALCTGRSRPNPITTFVIGYGTAFSSGTNSMLAAAGGTGACCDALDCANTNIDVCGLTDAQIRGYLTGITVGCDTVGLDPSIQCTGAIDAVTNADLKNAIQGIVATAACTFPLNVPAGYPGGAALPDPLATIVEIDHGTFSPPDLPIGNIVDCTSPVGSDTRDAVFAVTGDPVLADTYLNEGWCFATPARNIIQLTPLLCDDISNGIVSRVYTQLACPCVLTGQACTVTGLNCIQSDNSMGPCTTPQLQNMPCSDGIYACVGGVDTCQPTGAASLFEICNGRDDNCDGVTDNNDATYASWPDPSVADGKHCNGDNSCNCPNGAQETLTTDGNLNTLLVTNWSGACTCQSSLETSDTEAPIAADPDNNRAACTVGFGEQKSTFFLFFMVLGALGFSRRRLRR